jgi:predicted dienelactone hydrolase
MRRGERDEITPASHAELVKRGVRNPAIIDHNAIPGAGHFSFMSTFPPAMTRQDFPPSQDPDGFDRTKLHPSLHADILAFLERDL